MHGGGGRLTPAVDGGGGPGPCLPLLTLVTVSPAFLLLTQTLLDVTTTPETGPQSLQTASSPSEL